MNDRVRAVRDAVSIYDVLAERKISVATSSKPEKIHCPVHDDRHKSAVIYPDTQEIYCFSERKTYDVVSLISEWEGLEWWEACAWLEERVGLVYERQSDPQDEFWQLVRDRDQEKITGRQAYDLRWAIHRSVLELAAARGVEVDWTEFDVDCGLDIGKLRGWQRRYVDEDLVRLGDSPSGRGAVGGHSGVGVEAGL